MSETAVPSTETANQPDIQAGFEYWANALDVIESQANDYAGTNEIPDEAVPDGFQPIWDVKKHLVTGGEVTLSNLSRYFELSVKQESLDAIVMGREPRSVGEKFNDLLFLFEDQNIGEVVSQESSDGPLHQALLDLFAETNRKQDVTSLPTKVLKNLFGLEHTVELMGVKGDEFSNNIREIMKTSNALRWSYYLDNKEKGEVEWDEQKKWHREWLATGLSAYLDVERNDAYNYVFSAAPKHEVDDLIDIVGKFDHFGVDEIRNLSKKTGIYGLEAYSVNQLNRMIEFANDPTAVSERLADHDVVAVLVNRVGDHNGVLRRTAEDIDDESGRVLFFEINNMSDIYRRMVSLANVEIRPSTLLLASHSNEGQFMVSDDRDPGVKKRDIATVAARRAVEAVNISIDSDINPVGQKGYSLHGMRGMARLVDEFMTSSRAIDDDTNDKDRKKIIFSACYAGKETNVKDIDESGDAIKIGEESVVSQLAKDLSENGSNSAVDIYGASDGIQMHRTARGLRYSAQPKDGTFDREKLHAVRIRLEAGKLTKEEVDEIVIRKVA